MRQGVLHALDLFGRLLLEALHFDGLGDQHVIGLTDGLSGHVRRPRKPIIRDCVQRPADDVAILRHKTLKVPGQLRRTQQEPHEKGRQGNHPRSAVGTSGSASSSAWIGGHASAVGTRSLPAGSCVIISCCPSTYVLMSSSRVRYWRMLTMSLIEAPAFSRMAATFRHACRASSAKSAGMLPFSSRPGVPDTTIWS